MPAPNPWLLTPEEIEEERARAWTDWTVHFGSYNSWSFGLGTPWDITSVDGFADMMELKTQDAMLRGDGEVFGEDWEKKRIITVEFSGSGALLGRCFPARPDLLPSDELMEARCACMRRGNEGDLPLNINDRWVIMARPRKFVAPQRRAEPPKLTVSWEAQDPALYDATEQTASTTLHLAGHGRPYPFDWEAWEPPARPPVREGYQQRGPAGDAAFSWRYLGAGAGGLMQVENDGCRRTYLRARITGPVNRPMLINQRTFERLEFNLDLRQGETLEIDMRRGLVLLNGTASRYYQITGDSTWWSCGPGRTPVRFLSRGAVTTSRAQIWWRSAW